MIRTSTLVYLVLLLVLVGAYLYLRNRPEPAADIELTLEPETEVSYLFSAEEGKLSKIRVEADSGEAVELARNAENAWALTEPDAAAVNQGAAEAIATQATTMRILDTVPDVDPEIVGLEDPAHELTVGFTDGSEETVEIGMITPTESGYYVKHPAGQIVIVSRSAVDALIGLLENPPYLETPTPNPTENSPASVTATP
ncbi:MAG TPA: DUF4340 domain-containing protein [Anaerolineales bacterium]|nr:DUF4340 domain-containing protein [Anaerolineales bacterium]